LRHRGGWDEDAYGVGPENYSHYVGTPPAAARPVLKPHITGKQFAELDALNQTVGILFD